MLCPFLIATKRHTNITSFTTATAAAAAVSHLLMAIVIVIDPSKVQ
jgi:hypothetical protein